MRAWIAIAMLSTLACGSSGGSDCDSCNSDEVCVSYLGTDNDRHVCEPKPTECGDAVDCIDTPCVAALYDLCEDPAFGVGCSDTYEPAIVSCNE